MKPSVSALAPLLRSDTLGRLLAELYLHVGEERTLTALARAAATSQSNASKEIGRLVAAGYVESRNSGRNRYLKANETHPLFEPVTQILRHAYGPLTVLPPLLRRVPGLQEAYIYGSWAARLAGETGPDPEDIDVLAIGDHVDLDALESASELARAQLGREVNARAVAPAAWERADDLFLRHLRERPLLQIPLEEGEA